MSLPEPNLETLSGTQREKLLAFLERADAITGCTFNSGTDLSDLEHLGDALFDANLLARGLKAGLLLGFQGERLEELFQREFEIAGVTEGLLADWLSLLSVVDAERRVRCAAGGRN